MVQGRFGVKGFTCSGVLHIKALHPFAFRVRMPCGSTFLAKVSPCFSKATK